MDIKHTLTVLIPQLKSDAEIVIATVKEKGASRFIRPIGAGFLAVVICYQGLYMPPKKRLKQLDRQIKAAEATATYADEYMGLRDQIRGVHSRLPPLKDKETWLFDKIREAMLQEGLVAENLAPPQSSENFGVASQKMYLALDIDFPKLAVFIQRLENIPPFVHLAALDLTKSTGEKTGRNQVNFEITTVIPVRRPG